MISPLIHQPDAMDCGPACLAMIAKHYGKEYNIDNLRANSYIGRDGVSLLGISRAAENIGFKTVGGRITLDKLAEKALLPYIYNFHNHIKCGHDRLFVQKKITLSVDLRHLHSQCRNEAIQNKHLRFHILRHNPSPFHQNINYLP